MINLLNDVKISFLPISESSLKGLEHEAKITDFEILKELGSDKYGYVYLSEHKETKVKYAIKANNKKNNK